MAYDKCKQPEKQPATEAEPLDLPDFTGYWRQVKNENFDEYLRVLGLPWIVRKAAKKFGGGSTDVIWHKGKQMRVTTVNAKGAWTRMYSEGKDVYQKNAAGEPVRIKTWWEGKMHKCRTTGSSFGTLESWRYMEGSLMVVKSKVVAPDGSAASMYWFFEALPLTHGRRPRPAGQHQPEPLCRHELLRHVWKDQSLVEKATRRDNLHLQVLVHDLSRWETPADRFIQLVASPSAEERLAAANGGAGGSARLRSPRSSKPVSPANSMRSIRSRGGGLPPRGAAPASSAAAVAPSSSSPNAAVDSAVNGVEGGLGIGNGGLSPSPSTADLAGADSMPPPGTLSDSLPPSLSATTTAPPSMSNAPPSLPSTSVPAAAVYRDGGGGHRRVLSDPSSVLSHETPVSVGEEMSSEPPMEPAVERLRAADDAAIMPAALPQRRQSGDSDGRPLRQPARDSQGGGGSAVPSSSAAALAGSSSTAALSDVALSAAGGAPSGADSPPADGDASISAVAVTTTAASAGGGGEGLESPPAVESPRSNADALSGRSVATTSGVGHAIRATPRGTPKASLDQGDLEKLLAWKIHEFKDIRGIASVVPVKDPHHTAEPELLQMSPEQAEQTHVKLQELEQQAKLHRQVRDHSCGLICCMVSCHDTVVPDYLKSWETTI